MTNQISTHIISHSDAAENIAMHQQTSVYAFLRGFKRLDGTRVTQEQANDMAFAVFQIARSQATKRGV